MHRMQQLWMNSSIQYKIVTDRVAIAGMTPVGIFIEAYIVLYRFDRNIRRVPSDLQKPLMAFCS